MKLLAQELAKLALETARNPLDILVPTGAGFMGVPLTSDPSMRKTSSTVIQRHQGFAGPTFDCRAASSHITATEG